MIDLPDVGYTSFTLIPNDPGGPIPGTMGGPDDYLIRPGMRFGIQITTPLLDMDTAANFGGLLEQCAQQDGSYPWPMDFRPAGAGLPKVNGSSAAGSVIPIKGLIPGYPFRLGQPVAVISGGLGYVHRAASAQVADGSGNITLSVFPWTRATFANNDVVEIEHPRIRGIVTFNNPSQGAFGRRAYTFQVQERV